MARNKAHRGLGWSSRAAGDTAEFPQEEKRVINISLLSTQERWIDNI